MLGPATYAITENDQLAFNILHWRATVPRALVFVAIVIVCLMALSYIADGPESTLLVAVGGVAGAALMFTLARFVLVPRHAKRAYREFALIKEPVKLSMNDETFSIVQPSARVEASWTQIIAWNEDLKVFAMYVTRQQAYILPKGQVEDSMIDFARERLVATGLIARGKARK